MQNDGLLDSSSLFFSLTRTPIIQEDLCSAAEGQKQLRDWKNPWLFFGSDSLRMAYVTNTK
jgi:hypothetical protein